jgi:hypothetical protein
MMTFSFRSSLELMMTSFLLVLIGTGNDDFSEGGFHQRCGLGYVSEDYSTHAT